jgi:two-component sensor histidine kinase
VNQAIPCGLIINELVTNSIKYAYPTGKKGEIIINFYEDKGKYYLNIDDNGKGLPFDFDYKKSKSMGLKLVNSLIEQLHGKISFINDNGTKIRIEF